MVAEPDGRRAAVGLVASAPTLRTTARLALTRLGRTACAAILALWTRSLAAIASAGTMAAPLILPGCLLLLRRCDLGQAWRSGFRARRAAGGVLPLRRSFLLPVADCGLACAGCLRLRDRRLLAGLGSARTGRASA